MFWAILCTQSSSIFFFARSSFCYATAFYSKHRGKNTSIGWLLLLFFFSANSNSVCVTLIHVHAINEEKKLKTGQLHNAMYIIISSDISVVFWINVKPCYHTIGAIQSLGRWFNGITPTAATQKYPHFDVFTFYKDFSSVYIWIGKNFLLVSFWKAHVFFSFR